jgi:hypothetical protein
MKKYFESMISEDIEVGVALAKACVKSGNYESHFDHDYLDELMFNVLRAWEGFGTEETELSRGKLNAYFIQVVHVGIMGGDLGDVPKWDIDDVWMRLQLFSVLKGSSVVYNEKEM